VPRQYQNASARNAPGAEAVPALPAPVALAGGLPSHATEAPAAFATGGPSGTQTADAKPVSTSPRIASSPPIAPPAAPRAVVALSSELITFLLRRGDTVLQQGDVLSARLYFEQAAEAGSGPGAIGAAKTYDPAFLATIGATGLGANVARAIKWYRMASDLSGDQYADERLKALTAKTDR
jgi:hypothetical protein